MGWVTIHTVTYPTEAQVIQAQLESEGFEVYLKDELTVQVDNFYSNAIGGVKIQVPDKDAKEAHALLLQWDYVKEKTEDKKSFLTRIYEFTAKLPFLKKFIPELRLLILVGTSLILIFFSVYFLQPSKYDKLPGSVWCIDYIEFNQVLFEPFTDEFIVSRLNNQCEEGMKIESNYIDLPGFNTPRIQSEINLDNRTLTILNCDTLGFVFNGEYQLEIDGSKITMTSPTTTIWGFKQKEFSLSFNF